MGGLYGVRLELLSPTDVERILRSVTAEDGTSGAETGAGEPDLLGGLRWLLAHTTEGVVWGCRAGVGWYLSGTFFPEVSPPLVPAAIEELRIFGPDREILLWRVGPELRGRVLAEAPEEAVPKHLRPLDGQQVLIGDRVLDGPRGPFTLIGDATGARHAVPLPCGRNEISDRQRLVLRVRHYLTRDEESGAVRVAASRLVDLDRRAW